MCPKIIFSLLLLWNKAMPTYCLFAIASKSQNRFFHARDLLVAGALVSSPVPEPSKESEECFACSQSQHTGATLDFDNVMV